MTRITAIIISAITCTVAYAQSSALNDSLEHYFSYIKKNTPDSVLDHYNHKIDSAIWEAAQDETFLTHDLSKIKQIGDVKSKRDDLRIISWNYLQQSGTYHYFGFLLHLNENGIYIAKRLTDTSSGFREKPNNHTFNARQWYGSIYYEIVEVSHKKQVYYTLLGWRAKDLYVTEKVIEPLWFDDKGEAVFGADIFTYDNWPRKRMIFQYSAKTAMSLKFDAKKKRIVFDHLTPSQNIYGPYADYYGPEGSYDAYSFKGGKWEIEFDIDARNPKKQKDKKDR